MKPFRLATCLLGWLALSSSSHTQAAVVLVRHAPTLNGKVDGSVQQMMGEPTVLNGSSVISGDLFVPGTPSVLPNGSATYSGTLTGSGEALPTDYSVTLNKGSSLRHVITRTNPVVLPALTPLKPPLGTRSVVLNSTATATGDFATVRDLTLNSNTGQVSVSPGSYGKFTANNGSGFSLGVVGAATPSIYEFQNLVFSGGSKLQVVGPVVIRVANAFTAAGAMGNPANAAWLKVEIHSGGLTLNSGAEFFGFVTAPSSSGTVILNGKSNLTGGIICDRLTVFASAVLRLENEPSNMAPTATITLPANGAVFAAPATFSLQVEASDRDGSIRTVEVYSGATKLGDATRLGSSTTFAITLSLADAGSYSLTAVVVDDRGLSTTSSPVTIVVSAEPPRIAFKVPDDGTLLVAPVAVELSVEASAMNGRTISKVTFFEGSTRVGETSASGLSTSVYSLLFSIAQPGIYVLTAQAIDSGGLSATTLVPLTLTALARLPYSADFETSEGYVQGSLSGQLGWTTNRGNVRVMDLESAVSGTRAAALDPAIPVAQLEQAFGPTTQEIVFADFFAKSVAVTDTALLAAFDVQGARFGFMRIGDSGLLHAFAGDGAGGGHWVASGFSAALDGSARTQKWIRLTTRIDFSRKRWDLYADGRLVAADLSLEDASRTFVSSFILQGDQSGSLLIDDVFVGWPHPLFTDSNANGIDDAWEAEHGLSLSTDNRNLSPTNNGVTVLDAYIAGTNPNDFYNGSSPTLNIIAGNHQSGPAGQYNTLPFTIQVMNSTGAGVMINAPVSFAIESGDGFLARDNASGAPQSTMINVVTDESGRASVYYRHGKRALKQSTVTVNAGLAQAKFTTTSTALQILVSGGDSSLLQDSAGGTRTWGDNRLGQLGHGTAVSASQMQRTLGLDQPIVAASLGAGHGLAVVETGEVLAWGDNYFGQLGVPASGIVTSAQKVPELIEIVAVAAGDNHSLALRSDGSVLSWGDNRQGQLGDGTQLSHDIPAAIAGLAEVVAICANGQFSAVIKEDGSVWVWGSNEFGQMAQATPPFSAFPVRVELPLAAEKIVAGRHHVLVLHSNGSMTGWGASYGGQRGTTVSSGNFAPMLIPHLRNIAQIAAGDRHSAVLDSAGVVWVWGANEVGQLGDAANLPRVPPVPLSMTPSTAIACGRDHVIAMGSDGTLIAWGANGHSQLGAGLTDLMSPTPVPVLSAND